MDDIQKEMIAKLEMAIAKHGSMNKLAKEIGIGVAYISRVKSGKQYPSVKLMEALKHYRFFPVPSEPKAPAEPPQYKGLPAYLLEQL